jgi:adenosine deaminase
MNIDNDNEVREPDEVYAEQLQEDTRSDYEKEMDEAIQLSLQELHQQQQMYALYEKQLMEEYAKETERRANIFKDLLFQLNRTAAFDKSTAELLNILTPIIEAYCSQTIEVFELDQTTYQKVFGALKKIRNTSTVAEVLQAIIYANE